MKINAGTVSVSVQGINNLKPKAAFVLFQSVSILEALVACEKESKSEINLLVNLISEKKFSDLIEGSNLKLENPSGGILSKLPKTRHVKVMIDNSKRLRIFFWGKTSAIIWCKESGTIDLHVPDDSSNSLWMLKYFFYNLFTFFKKLYAVHASLVSINGKTIMISGSSGGGKTTASILSYILGGGMLVDDVCYFNEDWICSARSIRDFINVRPNTARLMPAIFTDYDKTNYSSFQEERNNQRQFPLKQFLNRAVKDIDTLKVDTILWLESKEYGDYEFSRTDKKVIQQKMADSLPAETIGWVSDSLKISIDYKRECVEIPSRIEVFSGVWSINDITGLKKVLLSTI